MVDWIKSSVAGVGESISIMELNQQTETKESRTQRTANFAASECRGTKKKKGDLLTAILRKLRRCGKFRCYRCFGKS